jgi:uncharacterized membrane protein
MENKDFFGNSALALLGICIAILIQLSGVAREQLNQSGHLKSCLFSLSIAIPALGLFIFINFYYGDKLLEAVMSKRALEWLLMIPLGVGLTTSARAIARLFEHHSQTISKIFIYALATVVFVSFVLVLAVDLKK